MNHQIVIGQPDSNKVLTAARLYLKNGWSVIPVQAGGKVPLLDWKLYTQRHPTETEISLWFSKPCNIGVITGQISGIAVIDLDGHEGIEQAQKLGLHSNLISITGKGRHLWFKIPNGFVVNNAVRRYQGIDVRGENGFVVVPPSIAKNGQRYRWLNSVVCVDKLPMFPIQIFAGNVIAPISHKEPGWIAKALEEMRNGNIDNTLTSVLGRFRRDGYSADDVRMLLAPIAEAKGASPGHLEEKIENIWNRYEPRPRNVLPTGLGQRMGESLIIHSPSNPNSIEQYKQRQLSMEGLDSNLRTGYSKLDSMLSNGLKSSRLFTIAARTGVGKTNWLLGAIKHLCRSGKRVLLFSTEMPYEEIWSRYLSMLDGYEEFVSHQFFVCDSFAPNLEKVEEAIKEIKPDIFMFDHINHVSEGHAELGEFMQGLNYLKRKYDCAGMITAQLNRSADWIDVQTGEKVTPRMSMIKGSGTIEQASSRVLLLSETKVLPEYTEIVGNLDKNDNGDKGIMHFGLFKNPYRMEQL